MNTLKVLKDNPNNDNKNSQIMSFIEKNINRIVRGLGLILVIIALILILSVAYVYFCVILPSRCEQPLIVRVIETVIAIWLLFSVLETFRRAALKEPGTPPPDLLSEEESLNIKASHENQIENQNLEEEYQPYELDGYRWCSICNKVKPPRTRHDRISNSCVLRLDHFCPWLNNTIGYHNHKFFILFLIYLSIGCLYAIYLTFPSFLQELGFSSSTKPVEGKLVFVCILCISTLVGVLFLTGWHFFLLLTNQTTIEFYLFQALKAEAIANGRTFQNPFDLGYRKNFEQFFDLQNKTWISFLWDFSPKKGNGYHFATNNKNTVDHTNQNIHWI
ncbi:palmitoyltransferase zdhhc16 [Anaeramoeba flamelloides]|uniref:Palmitoyltransferase n=1 Tax=Anaeramoeba flamelloides TaxID=1746091 RepID=A0AAV7ZB59_9EUKA|nr:palmitoyltransferase zdhhc16 [Anaeramoeba flamelloides]KAJ6244972.1 palmitoyltransferase zdhhc16 [Anaeramoeba flamelloides]